jgi:cytochrome P450
LSILSGDRVIPSGATIVIAAFAVQRNKEYWGEDADRFRPERFEPENFKKVPSYAYIPFTGKFNQFCLKIEN